MMTHDSSRALALAYGLTFDDLYALEGLKVLDSHFLSFLPEELRARLTHARDCPPQAKETTLLLLALAPMLEDFLAHLFGIDGEVRALQKRHTALAPLYQAKRLFVQRRAAKSPLCDEANRGLFPSPLPLRDEMEFAREVMLWLDDEQNHKEQLDEALRYAVWALMTPEGRARHGKGLLFHVQEKRDEMNLVPFCLDAKDGTLVGAESDQRARHGFDLTDKGATLTEALAETNYCIYCAHQGRDSCSKGLRDRTSGAFVRNPHGVQLAGCPLEVKISEFQELKTLGLSLAALGVICVDNPMAAATGHRICNDCVKACIYQKQKPVDIPQAESRTIKDVLALPWGFEIYSLLTRWNPLNLTRPLPREESGRSVLVAGLGPAGYTLAHALMQDGHHVMAVDGLKIEPLPTEVLDNPVYDVAVLEEKLSERIMAGFGGVAEYGITVRWNKNFLKLVRLLLERRERFAYAGGVRMGGTITISDAFSAGFDHVALCMGAGRPTLLNVPNALARGVRQASDFLMALQLTGAAKMDSLANLELRLPVLVIGGGLTAIDTATEALAYYPVQVEKFLRRYEILEAEGLADSFRASLGEEERRIAEVFLAHAHALRQAVDDSARRALLQSWGGATVVYRRSITEAPSYRLNHEEITLALQEGIRILDHATPVAVEVDACQHVRGLRIRRAAGTDGADPAADETVLPAGAILVAAGTQPNTVLAREDAFATLDPAGRFFQAVDEHGSPVTPEKCCKPHHVHVLMPDGDVSFFGDLHPSFAGNVVKAMASAKQGATQITRRLLKKSPRDPNPQQVLIETRRELSASIERVTELVPHIVEVTVRAPRAARRFKAGQFYRLQNFETFSPLIAEPRSETGEALRTRLAMEGVALTGAEISGDLVRLIVLEMGGSSSLCRYLKQGEPVVLMGPTGAPTEIPDGGETVLLIGGGLGNAVLFSIGQECRSKGNRVLYFAGYKSLSDRFKIGEIEAAADQIVWCCDEAPGFEPARDQDLGFIGNLLEALLAYGKEEPSLTFTGEQTHGFLSRGLDPVGERIPLSEVDRIICIGSDGLMAAVAEARRGEGALAPYLKPDHLAIGSINSPMQCMMKEVCAQCLQRHRDPETGEETVVFSCSHQDQALDRVDFGSLRQRLKQNAASEKLTAAWLARCLGKL